MIIRYLDEVVVHGHGHEVTFRPGVRIASTGDERPKNEVMV